MYLPHREGHGSLRKVYFVRKIFWISGSIIASKFVKDRDKRDILLLAENAEVFIKDFGGSVPFDVCAVVRIASIDNFFGRS